MKKVAIIIERTSISLGGAERSVAELAEELSAQGINSRILAASGQPSANTTILCSENPHQRVSLKTFENALRQHLARNTYDIIHSVLPFDFADVYQPMGGSYIETAIQNAHSHPHPLVRIWKKYTGFANPNRTAYMNAEKRLCAPDQKTVIAALSDYVRRQYLGHFQVAPQRIDLIPNGIQCSKPLDAKMIAAFRNSVIQQIPDSQRDKAVLFLFAANNFRLKGLRELIIAFSKAIPAALPDYPCLIIIGSGRISGYQALAKSKNIRDYILFCGQQDNPLPAISACDVAVLPSFYDPCSRFILEGIALEKPVITTQFNGAAEQFQDRRHGYVCPHPRDIQSMTNAIVSLCNSKHRAEMSLAIRQDNLKQKVSITHHVKQLIELYDRIIAHKKGSSNV